MVRRGPSADRGAAIVGGRRDLHHRGLASAARCHEREEDGYDPISPEAHGLNMGFTEA
jgi:hypothetical protein